jgi:hypothetical protein
MPYPKKQATAIFLRKKREEGLAAAKAFGAKHSEDLSGKGRSYKAKARRVSDIEDAEANNRGKSDAAQGNSTRPRRRRRSRGYTLSEGVNQANKRS